nr:YkvA family protein [Desulfallas sp. Bu1-1]
MIKRWIRRARKLKTELYVLYLAYRDPRVPWYGKLFAALVVAYAFSPVDLIPDFIPVLGYLDDVVLVPLGISIAMRMIPSPVLADCRERARRKFHASPSRAATAVVVLVWMGIIIILLYLLVKSFSGG